jgi:hypothetical protein
VLLGKRAGAEDQAATQLQEPTVNRTSVPSSEGSTEGVGEPMKKFLTILFYPFGFVLGYALGKGINLMNGEGL